MNEFLQTIIGLSLYSAMRKVQTSGYRLGDITYHESGKPRLTVTEARVKQKAEPEICLTVSGTNPMRFLPSIFNENDFLKRFLWIPQHIHYEVISILDNLHTFFTPMETNEEFLMWIGSWFNAQHFLDLDQEKMRAFLQNAMVLYRWRGTRLGMALMVKIITGIEPEIFENELPFDEYAVFDDSVPQKVLFENHNKSLPYFTVHIPIEGQSLSIREKAVIYELIKRERPVNTTFFVTYAAKDLDNSHSIIITDKTKIEDKAGIKT